MNCTVCGLELECHEATNRMQWGLSLHDTVGRDGIYIYNYIYLSGKINVRQNVQKWAFFGDFCLYELYTCRIGLKILWCVVEYLYSHITK